MIYVQIWFFYYVFSNLNIYQDLFVEFVIVNFSLEDIFYFDSIECMDELLESLILLEVVVGELIVLTI